jgi:hypothetical protein
MLFVISIEENLNLWTKIEPCLAAFISHVTIRGQTFYSFSSILGTLSRVLKLFGKNQPACKLIGKYYFGKVHLHIYK